MNAPAPAVTLIGITAAAERTGVSERALRYYQQLGLIAPSCTSGGFRRYRREDLARVERIRDMQNLLGLNLEEIADALAAEDRVGKIRTAYFDANTGEEERQKLLRESLQLHQQLRATVEAKRLAISGFLTDLEQRIDRIGVLLDRPQLRRTGLFGVKRRPGCVDQVLRRQYRHRQTESSARRRQPHYDTLPPELTAQVAKGRCRLHGHVHLGSCLLVASPTIETQTIIARGNWKVSSGRTLLRHE